MPLRWTIILLAVAEALLLRQPDAFAAELQHCRFEVVMFDTREPEKVPAWLGVLMPQPNHYVSLTTVLNYAYAKKYGYDFRYVHLDASHLRTNFSAPWHRVFYFQERLRNETDDSSCRWYLHVDSDAFVRPPWRSLPEFLTDVAKRYSINSDTGAIFAQEQQLPPDMPHTLHAVNAGVYLVHPNARSRHLFQVWASAATDDPLLQAQWPAEQGVLTELRFPGRYYTGLKLHHARLHKHEDIATDLSLVNMTEMNSPWGRFVEHLWSGPGSDLRHRGFLDALKDVQAEDGPTFHRLLAEARRRIVPWAPSQPSA